jgi:hypothetical protein
MGLRNKKLVQTLARNQRAWANPGLADRYVCASALDPSSLRPCDPSWQTQTRRGRQALTREEQERGVRTHETGRRSSLAAPIGNGKISPAFLVADACGVPLCNQLLISHLILYLIYLWCNPSIRILILCKFLYIRGVTMPEQLILILSSMILHPEMHEQGSPSACGCYVVWYQHNKYPQRISTTF